MLKIKKTAEFVAFLAAFLGGGYLAGMSSGSNHHGVAMATPQSGTVAVGAGPSGNTPHQHGAFKLSDSSTAPRVQLMLHQDPNAGWNLQVVTERFRFAPENAGTNHTMGEGHGHLYIDGEKISRLYGPWIHIAKLDPGTHEIEVQLATNSHSSYILQGEQAIADRITIHVPEAKNDS